MLPLGQIGKCFAAERKTRFTLEEQKTMMTLWCIFRSPLMLGAELTLLDDETKELITNEEVLSLIKNGREGEQVRRSENECVWKSRDSDSDTLYVALFNLSDEERGISVTINELNLHEKEYKVRDLWEKKDVDKKISGNEALTARIPAHGAKLYALS